MGVERGLHWSQGWYLETSFACHASHYLWTVANHIYLRNYAIAPVCDVTDIQLFVPVFSYPSSSRVCRKGNTVVDDITLVQGEALQSVRTSQEATRPTAIHKPVKAMRLFAATDIYRCVRICSSPGKIFCGLATLFLHFSV